MTKQEAIRKARAAIEAAVAAILDEAEGPGFDGVSRETVEAEAKLVLDLLEDGAVAELWEAGQRQGWNACALAADLSPDWLKGSR